MLVAISAHVQEVGSIQVVRLGMGAGSCLVSGAGFADFLFDCLPLCRLGRGLLVREAQELILQSLFLGQEELGSVDGVAVGGVLPLQLLVLDHS